MKQEPVAWMQTWENQDGEKYHTIEWTRIGNNDIPLYTHPAKTLTLTPDEIFDIWDEHTDYDGNFISDIDTFVLAILRKANKNA